LQVFILLVFVFVAMALKVTNDSHDLGWWIMVEEVEMPMLWITSHAVVEGQHWFTRRVVSDSWKTHMF
jgi:hypothetical protein